VTDTKGQNYMHGAAILTIGVVIMKILGFIYKVPIGNIIGDDGYSMFLATYNVYNVFLTLATAGFPVALARLVSEARAMERPAQVKRTFEVAELSFTVIGVVFAGIMLIFPRYIATDILHNPATDISIMAMAPSVLLVCLLSAHRGFCEGHGNMIPTTVGQVLEVLVKVVVGLALGWIFVSAGKGKAWGSAGAIFGVSIGSLAALVYMAIYKKKHYPDSASYSDTPDSRAKIFRRFVSIGIPVAAGSCVMAFLNLIDSGLCMGRLQLAAGFTLNKAQVLYGVYGKAQTLFNLPAAFITPLCIAVVPAIAGARAKGDNDAGTKIAEDSMRIASVISMPMGVGLAVLSGPIMRLLYPGSHAAGPALLSTMGIASFFVCIVLMENAILQASGKERFPMYSMIFGSVVKIVINWFLIGRPEINIYGAPIGTLVGYCTMAVMNFVFMCFVLDKNPKPLKILGGALICSALMGAAAFGTSKLLELLMGEGRVISAISLCLTIGVAVVVYAAGIIFTGSITAEDMKLIPKGEKIASVLHLK